MKKLYALVCLASVALLMTSCSRTYSCKCKVYDPQTGDVSYTTNTSTFSSGDPRPPKEPCRTWGEECEVKKL